MDDTDDVKNNLYRIDGFIPLLCYTLRRVIGENKLSDPDFWSSASIDHNFVGLCVFVVTLRIRAHSIQEDSFDRLLSSMYVWYCFAEYKHTKRNSFYN